MIFLKLEYIKKLSNRDCLMILELASKIILLIMMKILSIIQFLFYKLQNLLSYYKPLITNYKLSIKVTNQFNQFNQF